MERENGREWETQKEQGGHDENLQGQKSLGKSGGGWKSHKTGERPEGKKKR